MKSFNEFISINEQQVSNVDDSSHYNEMLTRVEIKTNYGSSNESYIYKGPLSNRNLVRKQIISGDKYSTHNFTAYTSLNYNNKPTIVLLYLDPGYNGMRSHTAIDSIEKFAMYTKIAFDNDINKAIYFFNKRFLSAIKLEIDKDIMLKGFEKFKDVDVNKLISNYYFSTLNDTFVLFDDLIFVKDRRPNPKSSKEQDLISRTNLYLSGITKYVSEQFDIPIEDLKDESSLIYFSVPKKSNPIRVRFGIRRDAFLLSRNKILSSEFFNKYKFYYKKINEIYKELEQISEKHTWNDSGSTDTISFMIDVTKIDKDLDFHKKIASYGSVNKFKLF